MHALQISHIVQAVHRLT